MIKNSLKIMSLINIISIAMLLLLNYFYQSNNFDYTLKCVCSSLFAIIGIINLGYALCTKQNDKRFYIGMTVAIIFSMLGDMFIYFSFVVGVGVFAISHLCFIATYCFIQKLQKLDFIIGTLFFIPSSLFLLLSPILVFEEPMLNLVCIVYALIISIMLGKAICNLLRERNTLNSIIALASILFYLSDFMLVLHYFSNICPWAVNACMAMYYPSLCIFAFSMHLKTSKSQ